MKIFSSKQIKEIDDLTMINEPVFSVDLMERAAGQLFNWINERFDRSDRIFIFAGPGNNGGDGLALARMMIENGYKVEIYYVQVSSKRTSDWEINRKRLENISSAELNVIVSTDQFPDIRGSDIVIDAIFGSGLTRPVEGVAGEVIRMINCTGARIISIDIPSGLFGEDNSKNSADNIVQASYTLSFQVPKLSFMFPENSKYVGNWFILPIGLHERAIMDTITPFFLISNSDINKILKNRNKFDHKGHFGHGLLVAGSKGKMGAAVLGAKAVLRTGAGLLTCFIPACGATIMQTTIPEAMVMTDISEEYISGEISTESFSAIGVGPGLGTADATREAIHNLLITCKIPIVIDADGLNIISLNPDLIALIPEGSVITPHPKEFERIAGKTDNSYARLMKQMDFSRDHKCIVVLKGANTSVSTPDGRVFFNSTGNPGMATAGSGDVLTGIILSLLAQGYSPEDASVTGVYLHGCAGDIAAGESCQESIIASDIIKCISRAFKRIRNFES